MKFSRPHAAALALAGGLFLFVTLGRLVSSEVFLDGVTYASIARNLSLGQGTFWHPHYVEGMGPFDQHPPLGLWLLSLWFRALGDHAWVEVAWGIFCGALACALVAALRRREGRWWPVVLMLAMPLVSWCWTNDMLEAPLMVFTLAAVLACLHGQGLLAGIAVCCAVMVKGPPGLFVLAAPLLLRDWRTFAWMAAGLFAGLGLFALSGGAEFFPQYVLNQVLPSALGERETAGSRLFLVAVLLRELALPLLIALALRTRADLSRARFFALLGLAGVAPFLLFRKQMEWYLAPALPFFALALAEAFDPPALRRWAPAAGGLLAAVGLVLGVAGRIDVTPAIALRDALQPALSARPTSEHAWRDFRRDILSAPPPVQGARISGEGVHDYFRALAYLQRHLRASLVRSPEPLLLVEVPAPPSGCSPLTIGQRFSLLRCENDSGHIPFSGAPQPEK